MDDITLTLDDLPAGTLARIDYLTDKYGSPDAVIAVAVQNLMDKETNPNLSSVGRTRLKQLAEAYQGTETAVIELALINLFQKMAVEREREPIKFQGAGIP